MIAENTVNDLIEIGWGLASRNWKGRALGYLISYFGPHHAYSKYFEKYVRTAARKSALAGAGILVAAKEQLTKRRIDPTWPAGYRTAMRRGLIQALCFLAHACRWAFFLPRLSMLRGA